MPTKLAPSRMRLVLRKASVALCSFLVLIGLSEILLRIHNPFQSRIRQGRVVLIADERLHIANNLIPALDPIITMSQNSLGLRGPEPPSNLPDEISVFTIGSSTTHCFYLSDGQTWSDKLSERLATEFRGIWLNNAGLDGGTSFGARVLLEDYLSKFHPKAAIFLLGSAEFAFQANREADSENIKGALLFNSASAFLKSLSPYSDLAALTNKFYRGHKRYQDGLLAGKVDLKALRTIDVTDAEQAAYLKRWAAKTELEGFGERLDQLMVVCRRNGIVPVLLTQPLLAGAGIDDLTGVDLARVETSPRHTGKMYWDLMENYNDVTRACARKWGVLLIDLARALPKSSRNFYDFIHFTSAGSAKTADIVNDGLCPELARRFPGYLTRPCGSERILAKERARASHD